MVSIEHRDSDPDTRSFFPVDLDTIGTIDGRRRMNLARFNMEQGRNIRQYNPNLLTIMRLVYSEIPTLSIGSFENGFYTAYGYYDRQGFENGVALPFVTPDFIDSFMQSRHEELDMSVQSERLRELRYLFGKKNGLTDFNFKNAIFTTNSEETDPLAYLSGAVTVDSTLKGLWLAGELEAMLQR